MANNKSNPMENASPLLKQYIGYLETVRGKSRKTASEYYLDLRTFFRYLKQKRKLVNPELEFQEISVDDVDLKMVESVTLSDVYEYLSYLSVERGNDSAARARKVSSLRTFYRYLTVTTGQLKENPVLQLESPKIKKSLPKYLTLDQSVALLDETDGKNKERDFCILTLFLNCGIRLSELCGINLSDIRDDHSMRVLGKGNKERVLYLNQACVEAIEAYLRVRPKEGVLDRNALFLSTRKQRISDKAVQHIVKGYLTRIGLENYSTHKLRHTAATLMYQYGHVDIRVLKEILGHENLGTTEIYTHLSNQQLRDAAYSNPLSNMSAKIEFSPEEEQELQKEAEQEQKTMKWKPGRPKKSLPKNES